jgi:DNA-binding NtrC family response regulator
MAAPEETLSEQGLGPARRSRAEPHLLLVLECDRPRVGPARYSLAGVDEVLVGRGPERTASREVVERARRLTVRVPDGWMSKSHASLRRSGGKFVLEDESSRNGSFMNGARVTRVAVDGADIIELGHTLFQVAYDVPTPEDMPQDADATSSSPAPTTLIPELAEMLASVERVASSRISIVLRGESGTGKEVLARAIHARSCRGGPFVAVNCGAMPDALVEGQLFGHVKGAFSGALRDEPGLVRAATGGTLFLDEVGDLPRPAQAALLRVLQEHEVLPVGATRTIPVDLRVVSATNRPLEALVESEEFRGDLLARLAGFSVTLPPLRARRADIGIFVALLLRDVAPPLEKLSLRVATGRALLRYHWPFNVRELRQCLALAVTLAEDGVIEPRHLPDRVAKRAEADVEREPRPVKQLDEQDEKLRTALLARLSEHHGNISDVARSFGRARMQIHRWMARFGLDAKQFRNGGE